MGRPLNKKFFGNRDEGKAGGFGVASVTLGGTNNSTGFTNGSSSQITFSAVGIPNGVLATGKIVTYSVAGALTNASVFTTNAGTKAAANVTAVTVAQKSATGGGTGATFLVTTTGGAASYTVGTNVTISVVSAGSGYTTSSTVTIDGASLGGVTSTNDLTFNVTSFVGTTGTISSITITDQGSGYITAPTATLSGGTTGTLTTTSVLTASGVATGSTTGYRDVTIRAYAYLTGGSRLEVDIIKQVSTRRFKVTDGTRTGICTLKNANSAAAGDMDIIANDSSSGTYYATKITKNRVTLKQGTGTVYTDNSSVPWTFGTATATVAKVLSRG